MSERIQTDPDAFVMLGFLNEHLQLKKQAVLAYQRCVCLEMDCVCLRVTVRLYLLFK